MTSQQRITQAVRMLMAARRETQFDIADVLGLSQAVVSRKLRDRTQWLLEDLDRLGEHYGVSFLASTDELLAPVLRAPVLAGRARDTDGYATPPLRLVRAA